MTKPSATDADLNEAVYALREELARLADRVAALEATSGARGLAAQSASAPAQTPTQRQSVPPAQEPLSEEMLLVLSAAIAAFFGKKPHIRQIRLIGTTAWAQQGRVTIQASHALALQHR